MSGKNIKKWIAIFLLCSFLTITSGCGSGFFEFLWRYSRPGSISVMVGSLIAQPFITLGILDTPPSPFGIGQPIIPGFPIDTTPVVPPIPGIDGPPPPIDPMDPVLVPPPVPTFKWNIQ